MFDYLYHQARPNHRLQQQDCHLFNLLILYQLLVTDLRSVESTQVSVAIIYVYSTTTINL